MSYSLYGHSGTSTVQTTATNTKRKYQRGSATGNLLLVTKRRLLLLFPCGLHHFIDGSQAELKADSR